MTRLKQKRYCYVTKRITVPTCSPVKPVAWSFQFPQGARKNCLDPISLGEKMRIVGPVACQKFSGESELVNERRRRKKSGQIFNRTSELIACLIAMTYFKVTALPPFPNFPIDCLSPFCQEKWKKSESASSIFYWASSFHSSRMGSFLHVWANQPVSGEQ